MASNKQLSIIIPVYNTEKYLKKCLDSVVAAADSCMEVLIINDGSTDNSEELILEYCQMHPTLFCYYKKQNGGLSDVKNYGLARASGEYVIFLDSDDYIEPQMYREMLSAAVSSQADVVVCDFQMVFENHTPSYVVHCNNPNRNTVFEQVLDTWMMGTSCNKIVKRILYNGLEFPKGMNNEDICVTPTVLGRANKIIVINKPFYNYLQRQGSIQNSEFDERRFVILDAAKMAVEYAKELPLEKQNLIKCSLYLHQILAMAMYPIREQPFKKRYLLLRKYMDNVYRLFPDFMNVGAFDEFVTWDGIRVRSYRKITLALLKNQLYRTTSLFFSIVNYFS
ncbi:MAG: glycosyltransferase [Lachnospiraceae bacterium]|jgi:glycosyltransferase involved in cell wall biosynthesis|nr:glycosyltransferase [Lachnospiraceae bacterium]